MKLRTYSNPNEVVLALSQETYDAIVREITGARDTSMDWVKHYEHHSDKDTKPAYLEAVEDVKRLNKYLEELG